MGRTLVRRSVALSEEFSRRLRKVDALLEIARSLPDFPAADIADWDLPPKRGNDRKKPVPCKVQGNVATPMSLAAAQDLINRRIFEYLETPNPAFALLVAAPAGSGKTTIGVSHAERLAVIGQTVLYAGPRHSLWDDLTGVSKELADRFGHFPRSLYWMEWYARQSENVKKGWPQTCIHAERQIKWMAKGWSAMDFCKKICGWDYINNECAFHAQKKAVHDPGAVVFGMHQHIFTGHPIPFDAVFIDECPLDAVLHQWEIPWQKIMPIGLSQELPLRKILDQMRTIARNKETSVNGHALMELLGGGAVVAQAIRDSALPSPEFYQPELREPADADDAFYAHIWTLRDILLKEAIADSEGKEYPHRVNVHEGKLLIDDRRYVNEKLPKHIVCLDATGNQALYQQMLGRPVEVVAPEIEMRGKVIQVWTNSWGRRQVLDYDKETKIEKINPLHGEKIHLLMEALAEKHEKVGVITFEILKALAPAKAVDLDVVGHFGGERGTNRFEKVDALIIAGTPLSPPYAIEKIAQSLNMNRMEPLVDAEGDYAWTKQIMPYDYVHEDGRGRAIETSGCWGDTDLQAVVWQKREAELIQAVHRARPLFQANVTVYLLSNIPLVGVRISELVSVEEVLGSPSHFDPYLWAKAFRFARQRHEEPDATITTQDLTEKLDIERRAAARLMDGLEKTGHWRKPTFAEKVRLRKKRGGRPQEVIVAC